MSAKYVENKVILRYLGQTGYLISANGVCVAVDPYLSYSVDRVCSDEKTTWRRNYAPPLVPKQLGDTDLVLLSHDHLDHTDPETLCGIVKYAPAAKFASSAAFTEKLVEYGVPRERTVALCADVPTEFCGKNGTTFTVLPIPAAHEELHPCECGGYEELGFVIEICDRRIYHGGDTCVYDGLASRIENVDAAIMPVNGRDEARHSIDVIGNMTADEAAHLGNIAKVGLVFPSHWDLYDGNGETEKNIIAAFGKYPDLKYKLMRPAETAEI